MCRLLNTQISYEYWLGGTDQEQEGEWRWVTGEKWKYSQWAGGEPNNYTGGENYLGVFSKPCGWNDENVGAPLPSLIEWDQ